MDPKQKAYEDAVEKLPPEVKEQRGKEYHEYITRQIRPLEERINLIKSVQPKTKEKQTGEVVRVWHPESKKEVDELRSRIKILYEKAVDRFWQGYEDLRPGDDE